MDPQSQVKERYENFIKSRQIQGNIQQPVNSSKPHHPFNKFYGLGLMLGVLILLPVTFVLLRSNTYDKGVSTTISSATNISDQELTNELILMQQRNISDDQVKKQAIRNILLKRAAKKELAQQVASLDSNYALSIFATESELEKKVVTSRTVEYVNVYIVPDKNLITKQKVALENLTFIKNELQKGRNMKTSYANLVKKLGKDPKYSVVENAYITKESAFLPEYITAIFKLNKGGISPVINAKGTNYMVVKATNAVNTKYNSFSSWEKDNLK